MATAESQLVERRAESLAIMYLTRRDDLMVSPQSDESEIDLLVTIRKNGRETGRMFAVQVKAARSLGLNKPATKLEIPTGIEQFAASEFPFPVCVFFFTMDDDRGYYHWLLEPVISAGKNSVLNRNTDATFSRLTDREIEKIVGAVNRWYDTRSSE